MVWIRSGVSGGGRDHYRISVPNWGLRALDVLRSCQCDHPFPVCACSEGLSGPRLLQRSKFLSSLAGWPAPEPRRPAPPPDPRLLRVGILTPAAEIGGAEVWMLSLLRECDRSQIHWTGVVCLHPANCDPFMRGRLAEHCPVRTGAEAADRLYRECDVVLVWGLLASEQRIPRRPRSCSVVLISHGCCGWTARVFADAGRADHFAAVSRVALQPIPEPFRARARIVENCYDPARLIPQRGRDAIRAEWGVEPSERVLGYLGRWSPEKNAIAAVRAAEALPEGWRSVVVGRGDELRPTLEHAALGLPALVTGPVEHPGDVLAGFDAMIVPSHEEGSCITLLEGWAAGLPVLCTPVGVALDHPELVRGIPLDPTPAAIAEALRADLADVDGTARRVAQAREVAEREYGPARFGREWTDFLAATAPHGVQVRIRRAGKPKVPLGTPKCRTCG